MAISLLFKEWQNNSQTLLLLTSKKSVKVVSHPYIFPSHLSSIVQKYEENNVQEVQKETLMALYDVRDTLETELKEIEVKEMKV